MALFGNFGMSRENGHNRIVNNGILADSLFRAKGKPNIFRCFCCQQQLCSVGFYFAYEILISKAAGIDTGPPWRAAWRRWSSCSDLKRLLSMPDSYLWNVVRALRLFKSS